MGDAASRWAEATRRTDRPKEDKLSPQDEKALAKLRSEAKEAGSDLATGGKGGLKPSLVLGAMRRDQFMCKRCGELGDMATNGGLTVHHKHFHLEDPKQRKKAAIATAAGVRNTEPQIVTLCARCHDQIHEQDREDNPQGSERESENKG